MNSNSYVLLAVSLFAKASAQTAVTSETTLTAAGTVKADESSVTESFKGLLAFFVPLVACCACCCLAFACFKNNLFGERSTKPPNTVEMKTVPPQVITTSQPSTTTYYTSQPTTTYTSQPTTNYTTYTTTKPVMIADL